MPMPRRSHDAVEQLTLEVCSKPEVQCVTYTELANWLDAHAGKLGAITDKTFPGLARTAG